jgi:ankyrin repeat protein
MRKAGSGSLVSLLVLVFAFWTSTPAAASELGDAVRADDLAKVNALIAGGADVNESNSFGTALHTAVARGNLDIIKALLDAGANIEAKAVGAAHPLHYAALNNQPAAAALLIKRGAQLESLNSLKMTPLMVAVANGKLETAEVLIGAGADLTASNRRFSVAEFAAFIGSIPVVKLLLSKGIDINVRNKDSGATMLFAVTTKVGHDQPATLDTRLAMITFLLDSGADPNIANAGGKTALDLATEDAVRSLLIAHGAKGT